MKPVLTDETNFTFKLPGGTEENDLPCVIDRDAGTVKSTWALDDDELKIYVAGTGGLFLQVYAHNTTVQVQHEGVELALEEVVSDRDGTLYVVGAAGITRQEIAEYPRVDLTVHAVPTPPVAIWVQPWPQPAGEPEGKSDLPVQRWNVVFEGHGLTDEEMRQKLDVLMRAANELDLVFTDLDHLPEVRDPEDLDSPGTKGA